MLPLARIFKIRFPLPCLRAASYVQFSLAHQHAIRSHSLVPIQSGHSNVSHLLGLYHHKSALWERACSCHALCQHTHVGSALAVWMLYPSSMCMQPGSGTHAVVKCRYGLHEVSLFTFYFVVNFLYLGRPSPRVRAMAAPLLARLRPETDAAAVGLHVRIGDSQLANAKMQDVTRYPPECGPPRAACG